MESVERIEARARIRYEMARLRRAVLGFAPVFVVVAVAALFAKRPSSTVAFGVVVFAVGAALLWHGRELRRAVLPGVAVGLVPLALALCANHVGHLCMGDHCTTLCIPACATGGVLAGLGAASIGIRRRSGIGVLLSMSGVALLTGAMGCACVGHAGLVGLALGFAAGLTPALVRKLFVKEELR